MKKYLLPFFLLGSLVMVYVMGKTGAPLKTPLTPNGILDLELAFNATTTGKIVNTWASFNSVDLVSAAKFNTWLDFIFIFFYAFFLYLAANKISTAFGGKFGKAGKFIAKGACAAGVLDVGENAGMLYALSGNISGTAAFLTSFCSVIKWLLAILAVLYVLTGSVAMIRTGFRK